MPYLYATEDLDYSDYASGRVIYNLPGAPAFPVRLASEIFQRARARLGLDRPLALYDPVCGGAYHLTALGFLHADGIASILASDSSPEALALARRNLSLLTPSGLAQRQAEIARMLAEFGKPSHAAALRSAEVLARQLGQPAGSRDLRVRAFQANALDAAALQQELAGETIDLVFSDVPYGLRSAWDLPQGSQEQGAGPLWSMLDALRQVLAPGSLVAVAADKQQKVAHASYQRVERFQVGKRQVAILQLV